MQDVLLSPQKRLIDEIKYCKKRRGNGAKVVILLDK